MNPRFIAICGNPTSGKSTAQTILHNALGYVPVDDGRPLRDIATKWLGLTEQQVTTQEGKLEMVEINGRPWQVRDVLGEIGNAMEEKFGGDVIPLMAMQHYGLLGEISRGGYSFGSVRREQGHFYRRHGGMVIEIARPGVEPSGFEFDRYDLNAVNATVWNDGSLQQLEDRLTYAVRWFTNSFDYTDGADPKYPFTESGIAPGYGQYQAREGVALYFRESDYAAPND